MTGAAPILRRPPRASAAVALAAAAVLAFAPAPAAAVPEPSPAREAARFHFADAGTEAGLGSPTWCGRPEKPHLMESGGTGLALLDYDRDGDLDLYLVDGWRLEGSEVVDRGGNRLYRNRGDGTFDDVTEPAGLASGGDGWGTGVAAGDVDGDGWIDLLTTNFGPDVLYRNRGDGSFEVVADAPGIDGWSTGAALFDADGDGDQDLFIAGQVDVTLEAVLHAEPELDWEGMKVMLGPFGLEGLADRYYENLGGGTFREATEEAGLKDVGLFYGFAVGALDLDGDLDLDLYVANDSNPNYLYSNDGSGRFREVGLWSGAALDQAGMAQAGMGLAAGDVDADGDPDLLVTNFYKDTATLYRNLGELIFEDVSRPVGVREPSYLALSWGTALADLDLDGDLDLFIANGHIYPQADLAPEAGGGYAQRNLLLENRGGRFADVTEEAGPGLAVVESSRGLAVGDVDGDGDLDLAVSNCDAPPDLLRNESTGPGGGWLLVDDPTALRAELEAGGTRQVRHRVFGSSYVSVNDQRFHFGLGLVPDGDPTVDLLRLVRPGGQDLEITGLPAGRTVVVRP